MDRLVVDSALVDSLLAQSTSGTDLGLISTVLIVALIATLVGLVYYLYRLRGDFYEACRETGNLELYASCPMGIPVGSVRSTLALLIVLFAIGYMGVTGVDEPPQFLTAVVSTVIGFYFGSRSSGGSQRNRDEVRAYMRRDATVPSRESPPIPESSPIPEPTPPPGASSPSGKAPASPPPTDSPPSPTRREEAQNLLDQLRDGLSITEVASSVLPDALRQRFTALTQTLQDGIGTVQTLVDEDDVEDALKTAKALLDRFRADNPVRTVVERARGTFGAVLGTAEKALPLIGTIATVTETLKEEVYDRWKKRILHTTFEPADLPLERVDADTGFTLLTSSPIMKEAFRDELEAQDRPFMEDTAEELLATDDLESLWSNYKNRFESRQQFEDGVGEMQRTAADLKLKEELDPALFKDTGGYEQTVATIDELHTDEAARRDLDAIVSMFEALHDADGVNISLRRLFEKVKNHLGASGSGASA
jgi:hypothetical protein